MSAMQRAALLLSLALCLTVAPTTRAGDRETEWSIQPGIGNRFSHQPPFVFDDLTFAGPYTVCPPDNTVGECVFGRLTDVRYGLEVNFPVLAGGGLDVRLPLGGALALDLGVTGTLAVRERRILRTQTGEIVRERPFESDEQFNAASNHDVFRSDGLDGMAYLHAGLRYTRDLRGSNQPGNRSRLRNVFLEAGAGWLPVVPGGDLSTLGHPLAVHGQAGLTLRRGVTGGLSLSVRYVRALAARDDALLVSSRPSWITFQVGIVPGR